MAEMRPDMLPDQSLNEPEVAPTPQKPTEPVSAEPVQSEAKGDRTPENKLYAALEEERTKRKELDARLKELESAQSVPFEGLSDEAQLLKKEIDSLKESVALRDVTDKFPVLKEKMSEFDEFRAEYPRTKLENVAKLFLAEHDLLEVTPIRKGLERPTGGDKTNPTTKYSSDDIDRMMKTDNRRFQQMIKDGRLKPEDIEADIK